MSIVVTKQKCSCGTFLIKDTECNGDWHPTCKGMVHQSFCPNDGKMWPLVKERPINYISRNGSKRLLNRLAINYKLRFKDLKQRIYYPILKYKDDKHDVVQIIAEKTHLSEEQIWSFCE